MDKSIIAAISTLGGVVLTYYFTSRREAKNKAYDEFNRINTEYFNHLRLFLAEAYFSLSDILGRVAKENGQCHDLLFIGTAKEVSDQDDEWFIGKGCFLLSTCYLTACLFYYMRKIRDDIPYLRLKVGDDPKLLSLMIAVNTGFLKDLGIFYVIQPSIGIDMYLPDQNRLRSYREFCQLLKNPDNRVWFDRLINFYLETGRGEHLERISEIMQAVKQLVEYIEAAVGGSSSIDAMMGVKWVRTQHCGL